MLAENSGSDDYSDDNYDDNFDEADDAAADLKLDRLRKAMAREATNATKVITKANIKVQR
jgi:hypothetical protein